MNRVPVSVLLAEDDPDEKDIFEGFLNGRKDVLLRGFFESGLDLLNYLDKIQEENEMPDLIFLDHNMPKFTGYQVLQQIRGSGRLASLPVVVFSTYVDTGLAGKCMEAGALAVFTKPLTAAGYNEMIDEVLRRMDL